MQQVALLFYMYVRRVSSFYILNKLKSDAIKANSSVSKQSEQTAYKHKCGVHSSCDTQTTMTQNEKQKRREKMLIFIMGKFLLPIYDVIRLVFAAQFPCAILIRLLSSSTAKKRTHSQTHRATLDYYCYLYVHPYTFQITLHFMVVSQCGRSYLFHNEFSIHILDGVRHH